MQEISLHILDITQNSITAGASLIRVELSRRPDRTLTVTVADNGCGMTPEQSAAVTNPFYTTRTTRRVGLGVPLFKMTCEMTGGTFRLESTRGKGTVMTAVYHEDHVDCLPLGDMASTMLSLIGANPTVDFLYSYRHGEAGFTLDTREIRAVMGDIPVNAPEVLSFIKDYIEENQKAIQENN